MRKPAKPHRRAAARRKPRGSPAGPVDLIGRPLHRYHREVLDLYRRTRALCAREDLPPFAARNLRASLAALYQVVNDAGIEFEHLYDIGV